MDKLEFPKLFSEFKIKNITLKNRFAFSPHYHALSSIESLPTQIEIDYYAERAKGGTGLIIAGGYAVSKSGQMNRTFLNASKVEGIENFKKMVKKVHKNGAKIF